MVFIKSVINEMGLEVYQLDNVECDFSQVDAVQLLEQSVNDNFNMYGDNYSVVSIESSEDEHQKRDLLVTSELVAEFERDPFEEEKKMEKGKWPTFGPFLKKKNNNDTLDSTLSQLQSSVVPVPPAMIPAIDITSTVPAAVELSTVPYPVVAPSSSTATVEMILKNAETVTQSEILVIDNDLKEALKDVNHLNGMKAISKRHAGFIRRERQEIERRRIKVEEVERALLLNESEILMYKSGMIERLKKKVNAYK